MPVVGPGDELRSVAMTKRCQLIATAAFLGSGVLIASWVMPEKDTPAPAPNPGATVEKTAPAKPTRGGTKR